MSTALTSAAATAVGVSAASAAATQAGASAASATASAAAAGAIDRTGAAASVSVPATVVAVPPVNAAQSSPVVAVTTPATHSSAPTAVATAPATSSMSSTTLTAGIVPPAAPSAAPSLKKSISGWVGCSGAGDETAGVAAAFAAARHGAFTLVVDCPVNVKIGSDIFRTIFIDEGTTVEFTGAGKFTVDNVLIPAFVLADVSNVSLVNWNVEYTGGLPVTEGSVYENKGEAVAGKAGNAFSDIRLTDWLAANRGIVFSRSAGVVHSQWNGTTDACAVFFFSGDTSQVAVTGMHLYVPPGVGGNKFIPVAFTFGANFRRNQTVTAETPMNSQHIATPSNLTFSNITLDGTYMGWVGSVGQSVWENIRSDRYGDLQDANGGNVGGVNKWFAPPHLFYLTYNLTQDPAFLNHNLQIHNVVDNGIRVGKARDNGGSDSISGYANSLKLGCINCSVDSYQSARPDGLMDVLNSESLTMTNITGTFNSSFTHNMYPGWRFPATSYKNVKFDNVSLTDTAANSIEGAIGNAGVAANQGLVLSNVTVVMNNWGRASAPFPGIAGTDNSVSLNYSVLDTSAQHIQARNSTVELEVSAQPVKIRAGQSTTIHWLTHDASSCSAAGSWTGSKITAGSQVLKITTPGVHEFSLTCRNSGYATTGTASVVVTQ